MDDHPFKSGGVAHSSSEHQRLMNKYRYSYQHNEVTPEEGRARAYSGKPGGDPDRDGGIEAKLLVEIMNTRPTPYNFDNENRSHLSVFTLMYNQLHFTIFGSTVEPGHSSLAYDRYVSVLEYV